MLRGLMSPLRFLGSFMPFMAAAEGREGRAKGRPGGSASWVRGPGAGARGMLRCKMAHIAKALAVASQHRGAELGCRAVGTPTELGSPGTAKHLGTPQPACKQAAWASNVLALTGEDLGQPFVLLQQQNHVLHRVRGGGGEPC